MQTRQLQLDVAAIQEQLAALQMDGWLFYSFRHSDPLANKILHLPEAHATRRWFYFIPKSGRPVKLVHRIEMEVLDSLPGEKEVYLGWKELEETLARILHGSTAVAMQYSPGNAVPCVSRVDAGTIEMVRKCGADVKSSADLVSCFESRLTGDQLQTHLQAVENLRSIVFDAFRYIAEALRDGNSLNEYMVQQFICRRYDEMKMISDSPPIVAVNEHSGSPHYQPNREQHSPIRQGDFVLLDMWAKLKSPGEAIYGDITWTGFVADSVPQKFSDIFAIVSGARDEAVAFIRKNVGDGKSIQGCQVDDAARNFIERHGYAHAFVHRTGHSIGTEVHGNGANIDNLETKDARLLLPNTCFSIEPGIYLPEFGVRSEIDVYLNDREVIIGGQPIQTEVIPILNCL